MQSTLSVNARPSRPSGKRTVNNFLSSLTTTLQIRSALSTVFLMHNPNKKEDEKGVQEWDIHLPELFKSIPPRVTFTSMPLWGKIFYNSNKKLLIKWHKVCLVLTWDINWMGRIIREGKKTKCHHIVQLNSTKGQFGRAPTDFNCLRELKSDSLAENNYLWSSKINFMKNRSSVRSESGEAIFFSSQLHSSF